MIYRFKKINTDRV